MSANSFKQLIKVSRIHCDRREYKMKCPNCKADIEDGSKFCPQCGLKLPAYCPKCGRQVEEDERFCIECGTMLEDSDISRTCLLYTSDAADEL